MAAEDWEQRYIKDVEELKTRVSALEEQAQRQKEEKLTAISCTLNGKPIMPRPSYCNGGPNCGRDKHGEWHCECINENKTKR